MQKAKNQWSNTSTKKITCVVLVSFLSVTQLTLFLVVLKMLYFVNILNNMQQQREYNTEVLNTGAVNRYCLWPHSRRCTAARQRSLICICSTTSVPPQIIRRQRLIGATVPGAKKVGDCCYNDSPHSSPQLLIFYPSCFIYNSLFIFLKYIKFQPSINS